MVRPRKTKPTKPAAGSSSSSSKVVGVQLTESQIEHLEAAARGLGVTRNELMRTAALERVAQLKNMDNEQTKLHVEGLARRVARVLYEDFAELAREEAEKTGLRSSAYEDNYSPQAELRDNLVESSIEQFTKAVKACGPEFTKLIVERLKEQPSTHSGRPRYVMPEELR